MRPISAQRHSLRPCISLINVLSHSLNAFSPEALSTTVSQPTYTTVMPAIRIGNLTMHEERNPPRTRVPRGRPKNVGQDRATYRESSCNEGKEKEGSVTALEETHHVGDSAGLREHWH